MPIQKSLRLSTEIVSEIDRIASETDEDFSTVAKELLGEAIKARKCPGILFTKGVRGESRARIEGTGIEVWEIIMQYKILGENLKKLKEAYHWLTVSQIRAALGYYAIYRDEIDKLVQKNEGWTEETLKARLPALSNRI